ncbi:unnamed protein product [Amoebophrya sp. A25]|nr:unnamed protein product [Amoebophrya sp. A25]|eukprot:GSA25T00015763001.1
MKENALGVSRRKGYLFLFASLAAIFSLHGTLFRVTQTKVPNAFMDEIFHVPQAQRYTKDWLKAEWDPKITTPAGIYIVAAAFHRLFSPFASLAAFENVYLSPSKLVQLVVLGAHAEEQEYAVDQVPHGSHQSTRNIISISAEQGEVPSVHFLRGLNSFVVGPVCFLLCVMIIQTLEKRVYRKPKGPSAAAAKAVTNNIHNSMALSVQLRAWRAHLLFLHFFYFFLFYTEPLSTLCLLSMLLVHLRSYHRAAGLCGCCSLLMRQLNVIWVFGVALAHLVHKLRQCQRSIATAKKTSTTSGTSSLFRTLIMCAIRIAILDLGFHIVAGAGFLAFLKWNDYNITLGHQEFHEVSPHLAMILYLGALVPLLGFLPRVVTRWFVNDPEDQTQDVLEREQKAKRLDSMSSAKTTTEDLGLAKQAAIGLKLWAFFSLCSTFPIAHPFLLADNRHLTFYIWRRAFGVPVIRIVACPFLATISVFTYAVDWWRGPIDVSVVEDTDTAARDTAPASTKQTITTATTMSSCISAEYWTFAAVFCLCSGLSLAALPLFELRYFLVPLLVLVLFRPLEAPRIEAVGLVLQIVLNVIVWGVFLGKSFENERAWGPGLQRIML